MAEHKAEHKSGSVGTYILIVLILGVITYAEFAIVEYPQAWLGQTWTLIVLAALSVLKFILVVMFFMHLKGDDRLYSGFFTSGMVIALASFIAMTAMFILPRAMNYGEAQERALAIEGTSAAHAEEHLDPEVEELIASDGRSRSAASRADAPAPADRTVPIERPMASNDASTYSVGGAESPLDLSAEGAEEPAGEGEVAGQEDSEEAAAESDLGPRPETEADSDLQAEPEAAEVEETLADDAEVAAEGGEDVEVEGDGEVAAAAEDEEDDAAGGEAAAAEWDREMGAQVYNANCSGCHQGAGQGIPGAFPPLAGHAADVYAAGGRDFLVQVVLYGLTGQIQVEGMTYNGLMPAWGHLSDEQNANVLNHIVAELSDAPSDFAPYTAEDVAAHRGDGLSASDVHEIREQLGL